MVTMKDIAEIAGVSVSTVSRVISGNASVSEKKKQKVLSTIKELGYFTNELARGLRQRQTNLIAVIIPSITDPFYADMVKGIGDVLDINGFVALFHDCDEDEEDEERTIEYMRSLDIAGALIAPTSSDHKDYSKILTSEIPYVYLTNVDTNIDTSFDAILHDYELAGYISAKHLWESGRTNIVYLSENCGQESCKEIENGYHRAIQELELQGNSYVLGNSAKSMKSNLDKIMQPKDGNFPDGIITDSDSLAVEVLRYFALNKNEVPTDTIIISFGNTLLARNAIPKLSSIGPSGYQIGMIGAQRLMRRIELDDEPEGILRIKPKLIIRGHENDE